MDLWAWDRFAQIAEEQGARPAVTQGPNTISFVALGAAGEGIAKGLNIAPGDRVLVCAPNSIAVVALITAIWRRGGIPVLVNAEAPAKHLIHAIEKTQAGLVFADTKIAPDGVAVRPLPDVAAGPEAAVPPHGRSEADHASIIFTSGSTGLPKGVVQRSGTLIDGALRVRAALGYRDDDSILCCVPFTFDYGWGQILSTLFCGLSMVLPEQPNGFGICAAIEAHAPTILAGVPAVYADLTFGLAKLAETRRDNIRLLTNTGSKIPDPVFDALIEYFPQAALSLNYGLTETYRSTTLPVELARSHRRSVGRPMPGVDLAVLRPDGTRVAPGEEGEIHHIGAGLFDSYWGDPERTAETHVTIDLDGRPVTAVRTGDFGFFDTEGLLYLTGRKDRIVKCMGVRLSLQEVEDEIYSTALVREVAVTSVDHDMFGAWIIAHVVPKPPDVDVGAKDLIKRLRKVLRQTLSAYMQPREYVLYDGLPRTTSRKVDYAALRETVLNRG